jgi:hypothetical protein
LDSRWAEILLRDEFLLMCRRLEDAPERLRQPLPLYVSASKDHPGD